MWTSEGPRTCVDWHIKDSFSNQDPKIVGEIIIDYAFQTKNGLSVPDLSGVFENILPFPYCYLFSRKSSHFSVSYGPKKFELDLELLQVQAQRLEQELTRFELSVLWFHGGEDNLPLLLHFVRKKLVRVGTLPRLIELVSKYQQKSLTPADLRQFFGTNAAFFEFKVDNFNNLDSPIESLTQTIREMVNNPSFRIVGESLVSLESPSVIDFEL